MTEYTKTQPQFISKSIRDLVDWIKATMYIRWVSLSDFQTHSLESFFILRVGEVFFSSVFFWDFDKKDNLLSAGFELGLKFGQ